jgi:hypothetical protein
LFHCASLAFLLGSDRNVLRHQAKNGATICAQAAGVAAQRALSIKYEFNFRTFDDA